MSLDPPSGARSSEPEPTGAPAGAGVHASGTSEIDPGLAGRVQACGSELLDALERHLPGSREHADGTASYAFATAVELDLGRARADAVRETARLHEIGKVYVPARVLARAREELGPGDQALLDSHLAYGAQLARGAGIPDQVCEWILATRESFDGSGPAGLAGEGLPLVSRVIRVACACDAILAAPGTGSADERRRNAIDELHAAAGRELDARVVEALARVLERPATTSS